MRYRILHQTSYRYSEPVTISHHVARLKPRALKLQECEEFRFVVRPNPAVQKSRTDFFGNDLRFFSLQEVHSSLDVSASSLVTVYPRSGIRLEASPPWEEVVGLFLEPVSPSDVAPYQFTFDSHLLRASSEFADYARPSFAPGRPLLDAVSDLIRRIHEDFKFDPKATTVATPIDEVMKQRQGVCQDFAHLGIACLRSLGLAARYASGYIRTVPPEGKPRLLGADASHAWLSVHCPSRGWVDFDPTNNLIPSEEHIAVAFGRDFADVSPVAGLLTGGGEHELNVAVDVEVVPASEPGTEPPGQPVRKTRVDPGCSPPG